ncbi:hypothetical protein OCU04_005696 [Sclerotinia nivalis]|uniref:Uncharacterized protein n=1 Tax=Sclerotinia nivalis TaxID=352851 RepID=A0A9X0DKS3_9HELO|nr:hypothetical protein OCU04_005696 [Sclerotinia nivalis]
MVGVKTWTDDGIWYVLLASEITKPNTSSTQKNGRPIRCFTDEEIAVLCKKNVQDLHHTPDANGVKYVRGSKKADAPQPSQAVLAAIERLRHQCNTSSQDEDSTGENMFRTPPNISGAKFPQVQGSGCSADTAPIPRPSRPVDLNSLASRTINNQNGTRAEQIIPGQSQNMNAMNPPDLARSHQMMERRGSHRPTNMFGNEQISRGQFDALHNMKQQDFDRSYQQGHGINGDFGILGFGSQQQHGQARRETTLPTTFSNSSGASMPAQLRQTMNHGQQMGTPMQSSNSIPQIPQQMFPSSMYQLQGNQMGSDTSIFQPKMQAYSHKTPTQSPHPRNYGGYTPGFLNLGRNEMISPGSTDVGRFTNPYDIPSHGQINGGMMSQGGQYNGGMMSHDEMPHKNQYLAQQQPGMRFPCLSSGMPDAQFKPPTSHGLPQTTINNPDFTTSHGLRQTTMNIPGSTNGSTKSFGNPAMSNNFGNQGGAAAQVKTICLQPQPSAGNERRHKRNVDEAGLSDMNPYENGERKNKRHNSEGGSGSGRLNHNDNNEQSGQNSIAHIPARTQGLHSAALVATPTVSPVVPFDSSIAAPAAAPLVAPAAHSPAQFNTDFSSLDIELSLFAPELFHDQVQGQFQQQVEASPAPTNVSSDFDDPPTPQIGEASNAAPASKSKENSNGLDRVTSNQQEATTAATNPNSTEQASLTMDDFSDFPDLVGADYNYSGSYHDVSDEQIQANHDFLNSKT